MTTGIAARNVSGLHTSRSMVRALTRRQKGAGTNSTTNFSVGAQGRPHPTRPPTRRSVDVSADTQTAADGAPTAQSAHSGKMTPMQSLTKGANAPVAADVLWVTLTWDRS